MNKILGIVFALALVLALVVPAMAQVTTSVTVSSGGGEIPIVKAKWEQEPPAQNANLESGDEAHATPGFQILPPMVKCETKDIEYYAVVTDAEDMGSVYEVYTLVYHPGDSPAPYNFDDPVFGEYFKYKVVMAKVGHDAAAKALVTTAYNAGLITFQTGYTLAEITNAAGTGEMDKGTADLWKGMEVIDYEQPAGDYTVLAYAVDHSNNISPVLSNEFNYVPTAGVEVDFTGIVYGNVNLNLEKIIAGDLTFAVPAALAGQGQTNRATVRNIGNTWAHVTINQNDMLFGKAGSLPATTYSGHVPPAGAQSNWNVFFDAAMGNVSKWYYDPNVTVTMDNFLGLSKMDELDFSILVKNGSGTHTGTMTIGATIQPFTMGTPSGVDVDPCP